MKKLRTIAVILLSLVILQGSNKAPFSQLDFTLQINQNINRNQFHKFWKVKKGLNIYYTTPFYTGEILAGCNYLSYKSKTNTRPDYQSYFIYTGWLYNIKIFEQATISPVIRFGNYLMNFDIDSQHEKYESEICIGYSVIFEYPLNSIININWEIGNEKIYTYKNLNFILLKAGINLQIEKPDWLKDFLE